MDLSNETMIHKKTDEIEYLQFRRLLEYQDELTHCYTLRKNNIDFNVISNNPIQEQKKEDSYQRLGEALGIKRKQIQRPNQTHTNRVEVVTSMEEKFDRVDGLLTKQREIALTLSYADCTPILLWDPVKKVIGNIHSGWKGTLQRIGQNAVKKMIQEYDCKPENIIACIGPCIGSCHFEVRDDVKNLFEKEFDFLQKKNSIITMGKIKEEQQRYYIDTTQINVEMLKDCGLQKNNIINSGICTMCHQDQIHSYRADKEKSGRNIAVMMLKKGE